MFDQSAAHGTGSDKLRFVGDRTSSNSQSSQMYKKYTKRIVDVALILMALPFLLPIMAIVTVLVALDGKSPFYSQQRIGLLGKTFRIWKFRTMVADAEAKLAKLIADDPEVAREWHENQKLANDPRITWVGRFLRKTSIDELPQLWNVLRGEMSLVGPRPMMTDQRELYPGKAYFAMRPGLTGFWQISDRNNTTFAARASFDTAYYQQMSLATDAKIIVSTVGVVVRGTGC